MSATFDDALNAFDAAQHHYLNGDPGPARAMFSRRDDVTLCNPVGPPYRGPELVDRAGAEPSSHFSDGVVSGYEEISRFVTDDLGYVVRIERGQTHIDGSPEPVPYALRVTMIIRQEGEGWSIAHRHADPITAPRPLDTIAEGRVEASTRQADAQRDSWNAVGDVRHQRYRAAQWHAGVER